MGRPLRVLSSAFVVCAAFCILVSPLASGQESTARVGFPAERSAYYVGEVVPLDLGAGESFHLEAVQGAAARTLYEGKSPAILLDTAPLAAGDYALRLNGQEAGVLRLVSAIRRSAASLQDETNIHSAKLPPKPTPEQAAELREKHAAALAASIREAGVSCFMAMGQADVGRMDWLDIAARGGAMGMANPDTRPTSFFPVGTDPVELASMSQRLILAAQANSRYPNFAGFCLGWDTTGYGTGNRRGLLTYWGWGNKTDALRQYLAAIDRQLGEEFQRRTGFKPVEESEYIAYLLAIKRPEFATAIDLPTRRWLDEIARYTQPQAEAERAAFEKRLDAWSAFLMDRYREAYGTLSEHARKVDPALRMTASVQVDHAPVRFGQYFPSAYQPLDLHYQSTWNDQVGGPDYAYQWLFTAGLLDMQRGGKPTWLSNTFGPVHGRADLPGKFVKVAAHGLAYGVTGAGFALEGFSNLFGGMNEHSRWQAIRGAAGGADVLAGHDFLARFAALAREGRGDHGVGILFSKSQYQRQHIAMGFGATAYQAFVSLARLGYTPRFVTEEELAAGGDLKLAAILVAGQTFPLPETVVARLGEFAQRGGKLLVDGNTTLTLTGAQRLDHSFSFSQLGKPHNWAAPSIAEGSNDALLAEEWHNRLAPVIAGAFGDTGRGLLTSERGAKTQVSLFQIDAGPDARYVAAVNDSLVQSQSDWVQVRERLKPAGAVAAPFAAGWVFDCTAEEPLGKLAPFDCDLTRTTARVFAVLAKEPAAIDVKAIQERTAGEPVAVSVRFADDQGAPIAAVIPFALTLTSPEGQVAVDWLRSTNREGRFDSTLPLPVNAPAGVWKLAVRSQLDGRTATLPITVAAAPVAPLAAPVDGVLVRERELVERTLAKGSRVLLPIFDSPAAEKLLPVAEEVKKTLAARGVEVEILHKPTIGTYWLTYAPTEAQVADNRKVESGEVIGRINRQTTNHNDWYAALSGWRCARPMLLLDLAGQTGDNPPAESLTSAGILWPQITPTFPGPQQGIVEAVAWAFGPEINSVVLRASDVEGLQAAVRALANLPADRLMPAIRQVKGELWRGYGVGPAVASAPVASAPPQDGALTARGLETGRSPKPFAITFPGDRLPPATLTERKTKPVVPTAVPARFEPKQFAIQVRDGERLVDSATAGMLVPDLRFSDAIKLVIEVPEAGQYRIVARGVFRTSDRKPCWQAQWEDVIELREKLVPKQRRPQAFAVWVDGKVVGLLDKVVTAEREVPLELASASAGLKPKTAVEEVGIELSGAVTLPAGVHVLSLAQENIVDGKLETIDLAR